MDVEGHITLVKQKFCDMLGYTEEELVGTWVVDITAPDSVPVTLAAVGKVVTEGSGQVVDKHYRCLPGIEQPCLVALTGWGAEHDRARSAAAGFDCHLTKPVELATVLGLLAEVAGGAA